jgi:hypothetical protein
MLSRLLLALVAAACLCTTAEAGPFRRRSLSPQTCTGPNCSGGAAAGDTSTAQGVAEIQARSGRMAHHGGNSSYEGVGMGGSPEAALANCCNNGRAVVDQGTAQGRDGRWYACKRYAR